MSHVDPGELSASAAQAPESSDGERRFRCLVEHVSDAFLLYDDQGLLLDVNRAACETYGYERERLLTLSLDDLDAGAGAAELTEARAKLCDDEPLVFERLHRRADGSSFPVQVRVALLDAGDSEPLMALVRDLSDSRRSEEQIAYLGDHDTLTGLLNHTSLTRNMELAIDRAHRQGLAVALLHVDLNRFGLINDGLGREAGDDVLRQTASRLREVVDPMDLVARYSADRFLLLLPDRTDQDAPVSEASACAEKVHRVLAAPFEVAGTELYVDAAVGISRCPADADSADVLLRHAEAAARQAKRPGEIPSKIFAGDTSDKWARLWLATRLRTAVEREQLELRYQPIVDLTPLHGSESGARTGEPRLVAAEALVRMRADDGGLVPPSRFIPLAEDIGLIEGIGNWVLEEVCRQSQRWRDDGRALDLSFNLSLRQLWQPNLVDRIRETAECAEVPPESLVAEITESTAMTDPVRAQAVLGALRKHGFRLAIDDFGVGHSSLTRLWQMPAETLKIDRSFISRLPGDPTSAAMVTAIIELAGNLGMRAIAEGVETEEQLEFLVRRCCPLAQGYLFSRPVPADQIRRG